MAQRTDDHRNYMFTDPNSPNSNSSGTRVYENYAPTLSSGLTLQSPVIVNNAHQIPQSPHHLFHRLPTHELHHPQPPVLAAYGFGAQPREELPYVPPDGPNADPYAYRPGADPPIAGERNTPYQPDWTAIRGHQNGYPGHDISRGVWSGSSQQSNTGPSHNGTEAMSYGFHGPWNGEGSSSFSHPTSPQASHLMHRGREGMSPVEAHWSPNRARYQPLPPQAHPPPALNNDQCHQDHVHYSPPSASGATPPAHGPFSHFPAQDPARNITYSVQGKGVDDANNSAMLGLGSRIDCSCGTTHMSSASPGCLTHPSALGSDYTAHNSGHNSDHNQPSTSAHVFEGQIGGPSRPAVLSDDLEAHFPNSPGLKALALYILSQPWCDHNDGEPLVSHDEPSGLLKFLKRTPKSRFEAFFDAKLRCHVVEANGDRCLHVTTRKDRAVAHARAHFGYKPFACGGKCGKVGCLERYTCSSFRNDHVGRKKNPKRPCNICQKLLTAQNLKRHMKQHSTPSNQATPFTSQEEELEVRPSKRPKLSIFRRLGKK